MTDKKTIKVALIGDEAVGKSALVRRLLTGVFDPDYRPTLIYDTACIKTDQKQSLSFWDMSGSQKFSYHEIPLQKTNIAIFMFDVTSSLSYKNLFKRINDFQESFPDVPFLICGNKCDSKRREITSKYNVLPICYDVPYFDISVKSGFNVDKIISCIYEVIYELIYSTKKLDPLIDE